MPKWFFSSLNLITLTLTLTVTLALALPFTLLNPFFSSSLSAYCQQSADISLGWRRDALHWKMRGLESSYVSGRADSKILFKKMDSYTISGNAKWADHFYYIRLSGEYGSSYKGRALEHFRINSPLLCCPIEVNTSDPIKRRSEVYDFNIAAGYPFCFCCSRLTVVPLIGFSFHRQHLRVKHDKNKYCCCCCCGSYCCSSSSCYPPCSSSRCPRCFHRPDYPSSRCCCPRRSSSSSSCSSLSSFFSSLSSFSPFSSDFWTSSNSNRSRPRCSSYRNSSLCKRSYHSSSHFSLDSSNPFAHSPSSNPFQSSSDPNIANALGLSNPHRNDNYRFTWYGFYLGTDLSYALDPCWSLFSELEFHFLDYTHRKRKSWTGVYFVDDHHKKDYSYGFNTVLGLTYTFCSCWYSMISVDFRWWKSPSSHDELTWKMAGVKAGLGYLF